MNGTYRYRRSVVATYGGFSVFVSLYPGLIATAVFSAMAETRPWLAACLACLTALTLLTGIVLSIIAPWKHRLLVAENEVSAVGIFGPRTILLEEMSEARWNVGAMGRRLLLKTARQRVRINFDCYREEQSQELIRFFRFRVPVEVQSGWNKFWQQSWQLFDEPSPDQLEAISRETRGLRRRMNVLFGLGELAAILIAYFGWPYFGARAFLAAIPLLLLWPFVQWGYTAPRRGPIRERYFPASNYDLRWPELVAWTLCWPASLVAVKLTGKGTWCTIIGIACSAVVGLSLLLIIRRGLIWERHQRSVQEDAAQAAEREYLQPLTSPPVS